MKTIEQLEGEIKDLRKQLEDKRFAVGARGPAGDAEYAARLATAAASEIVSEVKKSTFDEAARRLNTAEEKVTVILEEYTAQLEDHVCEHVIKILREYHVIDELNVPYTYGK